MAIQNYLLLTLLLLFLVTMLLGAINVFHGIGEKEKKHIWCANGFSVAAWNVLLLCKLFRKQSVEADTIAN